MLKGRWPGTEEKSAKTENVEGSKGHLPVGREALRSSSPWPALRCGKDPDL